jgi:hypothetical protein
MANWEQAKERAPAQNLATAVESSHEREVPPRCSGRCCGR